MQRVAHQMGLECAGEKSVSRTGKVQDPQMNIENAHVDKNRQSYEACGPGQEMLDSVTDGSGQVAENVPKIGDGPEADENDDEQSYEFDADRAG